MLTSKHWRLGESPWRGHAGFVAPSARLIIDNDFSGDPDDLYQIVHHLLSPSVGIRAIVASHLRPGDGMDPSDRTATNAELVARDVFARMGLDSTEDSGLSARGAAQLAADALGGGFEPVESDTLEPRGDNAAARSRWASALTLARNAAATGGGAKQV